MIQKRTAIQTAKKWQELKPSFADFVAGKPVTPQMVKEATELETELAESREQNKALRLEHQKVVLLVEFMRDEGITSGRTVGITNKTKIYR